MSDVAFKPKKKVTLNTGSRQIRDYIKRHGLSVEQVAQNLTSKNNPDGYHANWLNIRIDRGLDDASIKAIKTVVSQLDEQKQKAAKMAENK